MTVELVCPFCHFSKKVPEKKIPVSAKWAICPRCHQKFEIARSNRESIPFPEEEQLAGQHEVGQEPPQELERSGAPWENRSEIGFTRGILYTFKNTLFSPSTFFKGLSVKAGIREPLAFGLLIGAVGNMFGLFWPVMMLSGGLFPFGEAFFAHLTAGLIFLILVVVVPVCVMLSMFVYSGILHLLFLIVRGGKNGFEATFRVVAYSQAAQAWGMIPVVGSWVGGIWQLIVQVIGLREIHGISYLRVFMAFLLPVGILFLVAIAVLISLIGYFAQ
ncbi:MAG: YIP1 family protein [Pseudomonadota bacterium]